MQTQSLSDDLSRILLSNKHAAWLSSLPPLSANNGHLMILQLITLVKLRRNLCKTTSVLLFEYPKTLVIYMLPSARSRRLFFLPDLVHPHGSWVFNHRLGRVLDRESGQRSARTRCRWLEVGWGACLDSPSPGHGDERPRREYSINVSDGIHELMLKPKLQTQ